MTRCDTGLHLLFDVSGGWQFISPRTLLVSRRPRRPPRSAGCWPWPPCREPPSFARGKEGEEEGAPAFGGVEDRAMTRPVDHLDLYPTARLLVPLEHRADLRDHGLRREHLLTGPSGDRPSLPQRSHLPGRAV